jgi:hypothetical protein
MFLYIDWNVRRNVPNADPFFLLCIAPRDFQQRQVCSMPPRKPRLCDCIRLCYGKERELPYQTWYKHQQGRDDEQALQDFEMMREAVGDVRGRKRQRIPSPSPEHLSPEPAPSQDHNDYAMPVRCLLAFATG